jgi:hypothetical protein
MTLRHQRRQQRRGILDQAFERYLIVEDAIDERGVGAVLEQPANQIRQQVLVAADRGIDPTRDGAVIGPHQPLVQGFAHAVQALKLEAAPVAG